MDKFSIFASLDCHNFVLGSKDFVCSGIDTMDSIMALKDHWNMSVMVDSQGSPNIKY